MTYPFFLRICGVSSTMANDRPLFFSIAYGLVIQSEFPLLKSSVPVEKWTAKQPPDLVIRSGILDDFKEPGNGYSIIHAVVPEFGKFLMKHGIELIALPENNLKLEDLRAILLGSALAVILQQREQLVLHASSVGIQNHGVAFLGNSGWGKSTLVSTLHAKGYDFITDDVLSIDLESTPPQVTPSYPEVRLRPDTIETLGHTFELSDSDIQSHWKEEKLVESRVADRPFPLLCLYILGVGESHEIEPVTLQNAFLELSHHSRAIRVINSLDVKGLRASHFKQCMRLIQTVPVFYLRRRRSLQEMPEVVALIEDHVHQLTAS